MKDILNSIKIMDLSNFLPGPLCSMLLSEYGAEVIKIEDVISGDPLRSLPPFHKFENSIFHFVNKNKKSIQLNLKSDEGIKIFEKLASNADVIIESFRPGKTESLDIDYKKISKINPKIIYCSMTGYGQNSPLKNAAGHDINFISLSGFLAMNKKESPIIPPTQIGDIAGAFSAASKILLALYSREKCGKGCYIDISITDSMICFMFPVIMEYFSSELNKNGFEDTRPLTGKFPCYNIYKTKDGKYVSLGALEPMFWSEFCSYFKAANLIEKQFDTSSETFDAVKGIFLKRKFKEIEKISYETSFCLTPVYGLKESLNSEYMKGKKKKVNHLTDGVIDMPSIENSKSRPAPRLGEHTFEILGNLGFKKDEIVRLKGDKVIGYLEI